MYMYTPHIIHRCIIITSRISNYVSYRFEWNDQIHIGPQWSISRFRKVARVSHCRNPFLIQCSCLRRCQRQHPKAANCHTSSNCIWLQWSITCSWTFDLWTINEYMDEYLNKNIWTLVIQWHPVYDIWMHIMRNVALPGKSPGTPTSEERRRASSAWKGKIQYDSDIVSQY